MARADLLKQLFRAYRNSDRENFMDAARAIVDEERKKHHPALAEELLRVLNNGVVVASPTLARALPPPPRDQDRRTALLEIRHPDRFLKDLVLERPVKDVLDRVLREFRAWDVLEASGLNPSHKLLFCGPPGCGKTATAQALAGELGLPLLYVRFDSVVSSLLGETAANLRKVFEYASQDNWVILFDEFDAIGRSRDDSTEHGEIKRVVNSLLQMLDNFKGRSMIIAATNFGQSLDPAIWRRFDEIVRFPRPTLQQLHDLMSLRLIPAANEDVSFRPYIQKLKGSSFGDAEQVCLDVLKTCALDGRTRFTKSDLHDAIARLGRRRGILRASTPIETPRVDQP